MAKRSDGKSRMKKIVMLIVVAIVAFGLHHFGIIDLHEILSDGNSSQSTTTTTREPSPVADRDEPAPARTDTDLPAGVERVRRAYRDHTSNIWLEVAGTVHKVLRDDNEGSRHQKFILRLDRDLTILVAHNIDLAPRVPLSEGDDVLLRGEYEWTDQGGTIHWTHHDPDGRREGGWIEHDGLLYE